MFSATESDALHARVRAFINAAMRGDPVEPFDVLALDIARFQAAHIPVIARLAHARRTHFTRDASAIPAVPCDVFRLARVAVHPRGCDVALFRTSGTSQAARGEHPLRTTETYELAALSWGRRLLWPDRDDLRALVLSPSIAEQPDSSLSFMLDRFARALARPPAFLVHVGTRRSQKPRDAADPPPPQAFIDIASLERDAAAARAERAPALVLATTLALVRLLDEAGSADLRLPEGSRIMQTGGFKGRSRELAPDVLRRMVARAFNVRKDHVVGEYGMTELSSQLYEGTLAAAHGKGPLLPHGVYVPPPWMRVDAVDPTSLEPVPPGQIGIARIVDLANVDSAVAVQTADLVRIVDGGVELHGRLPRATPRGCSIAIDEMLGRG